MGECCRRGGAALAVLAAGFAVGTAAPASAQLPVVMEEPCEGLKLNRVTAPARGVVHATIHNATGESEGSAARSVRFKVHYTRGSHEYVSDWQEIGPAGTARADLFAVGDWHRWNRYSRAEAVISFTDCSSEPVS